MHHVACTSDDSSPACCLSVRRSFFRWGCACGRKVRGIREKPRPAQSTGTSKTPLSFSPPVPPPRISAPRQTCSSFLYVVRVRRGFIFLQYVQRWIAHRACAAVSTICNTISCMSRWRNVIHAAAMPLPQLACYNCYRMDRSGTLGQRTRQRCNTETLRAHPPAC
jgi:hypothetical protein